MDTRNKILKREEAERLEGHLTVVTGWFDVLRPAHVRELEQARRPVLAAVLRHTGAVLSATARAELAAALRMVDYVVTVDHEELEGFIERLKAAAVLRLETAESGWTRRLREDAQRSQSR